jgi:hypothetical protein
MMANDSASGGYLVPISAGLTDAEQEDIFTALIVGLTGLDESLVRPRFQDTLPKMPGKGIDWCAVSVTDDTGASSDASITHDGEAEVDTLTRQSQLKVLATFYGPTAKAMAEQVRDGLAIEQNRAALLESYISFVACGNIVAVPDLLGEQWRRGYDLPMWFNRATNRTYPVKNIVEATDTLNAASIHVIQN